MGCIIKNLNPKMKECIQLEIEHPNWQAQQLADALGLSRPTIYGYWGSPVYIEARDAELRRVWHGAIKIAQEKMILMAKDGNFNAAQYILNSGGYAPSQKIDLDTDINITINIDE